jgi:hypothetical protein
LIWSRPAGFDPTEQPPMTSAKSTKSIFMYPPAVLPFKSFNRFAPFKRSTRAKCLKCFQFSTIWTGSRFV